LREALQSDWEWIAKYSNGLVIGPNWATSRGTISEIACHQALGLPVWETHIFLDTYSHQSDQRDLFSPDWQFPALSNYLI
jgi:hypothetical protein